MVPILEVMERRLSEELPGIHVDLLFLVYNLYCRLYNMRDSILNMRLVYRRECMRELLDREVVVVK